MAGLILAVLECKGSHLKKTSFELVGAARVLAANKGAKVAALVLGNIEANAVEILKEYGVQEVFLKTGEALEQYDPHSYAIQVVETLKAMQPTVVLASASLNGKDLMPRVAALLDRPLASDCIGVEWKESSLQVIRPVYAGKATVRLSFTGAAPFLVSLRPNVFSATKQQAPDFKIEQKSHNATSEPQCQILEVRQGIHSRPDLTEANFIVSGGRSLKSADNFKILFELADVLGASVGASRAAVDAGYAPHDMQVGQTGKVVSPKLYIACGISGAIQHLAGMRTSKVIVAINTDRDAPIFKKADYGIVGDLFQVVPALTQAMKRLLG